MGTGKAWREPILIENIDMVGKNKKPAIILLARLDSKRLPNKALKDLQGRAVLGRVIDRLKKCKYINHIILATSDRKIDDPLEEFAKYENIDIFRGSIGNVADRCLQTCKKFDLDYFIRICGDSPFIDPAIIDEISQKFIENDCDIATNVFPRTYPAGISVEVISNAAMAKICQSTNDLKYLEHVTKYAYENPNDFNIINVKANNDDYNNCAISIDNPTDFKMANWVISNLNDPKNASLEEILIEFRKWQKYIQE